MINNKEKISIEHQYIRYISGGNIVESEEFFNYVLVNEQQEVISREYDYIEKLYDDHYIVDNAVVTIDRDKKVPETIAKVQCGVIRLNRDDNGRVIPYSEKTIVPFVFDNIHASNSNTVIAVITSECWSGYPRYTYIDLDLGSKNYGQPLLPVILDSAESFGQDYEGFAKCRLYGEDRYVPRNCEPMQKVKSDDLLTETEVKCLLNDAPKVKMKSLTGGCTKAQVPKK